MGEVRVCQPEVILGAPKKTPRRRGVVVSSFQPDGSCFSPEGTPWQANSMGAQSECFTALPICCKIWYSISQTVSDLGNVYDRSLRAFAVKPRASGAPVSGFGA